MDAGFVTRPDRTLSDGFARHLYTAFTEFMTEKNSPIRPIITCESSDFCTGAERLAMGGDQTDQFIRAAANRLVVRAD